MKKLKLTTKFRSKPSYDLYIQLGHTLKIYWNRINSYIFFKYYKWEVPKIRLIKKVNCNDIFILRSVLEYDYKIFKVLLFLYWDLECYLDNTDNVKHLLKVELDEDKLYNVMFRNEKKTYKEFLAKMILRKPINLGTNLEIHGMFDKILKYNFYSNIYSLDSINNVSVNFQKYQDLMIMHDGTIYTLRVIQKTFIEINYYESYIEEGYKEGRSEKQKDLTTKYKYKIQSLNFELKKLVELENPIYP